LAKVDDDILRFRRLFMTIDCTRKSAQFMQLD
jgi:hypothetical protein